MDFELKVDVVVNVLNIWQLSLLKFEVEKWNSMIENH